jgi:hypothetical protein
MKLEIGTDVNRLPLWFLNFLHQTNIFESSNSKDWEDRFEVQLTKYNAAIAFDNKSIFIQFDTEEHCSIFLMRFS